MQEAFVGLGLGSYERTCLVVGHKCLSITDSEHGVADQSRELAQDSLRGYHEPLRPKPKHDGGLSGSAACAPIRQRAAAAEARRALRQLLMSFPYWKTKMR